MCAAEGGHTETAALLLARGAEVNKIDRVSLNISQVAPIYCQLLLCLYS